ncbi:hypothetical protein BsWGS_21207 [Bradybaena similaris]
MSSKASSEDGDEEQQLKGMEKSHSSTSIKVADIECIRKHLAKRSLDAKFDLQGSDYKPIENIGIGAYGVVCSAIHTKSADRVAIKKIPSVFEALSVAKRTFREIKILKHFKHDNIISIREILLPKQNVTDFRDIYVVFDLMESDLHRIIYSKQELSEEHIRYFLYQLLRGLKYIHSANVIHRDLKPSNVLVNEDCHLRIGDFGMARGVFYTPDEPSYYMTQYVATRWYRAPEILLSMLEYGAALDMWSVGCIFAEMMGRKHLFPGKDYISQVKLIVGVLGTPSESVLKKCHHDILKKMIKGFGKKEPISWEKLFPKASKKSLDLVSKMLVINPEDRISVDQALSHRLLNNYHDASDEPICVPPFNFDFEKEDMDKSCLRSAIMEEIMSFHQPKQQPLSFNAFLRPAPKFEETATKELKVKKVSDQSLISTQLAAVMELTQKELVKEAVFKMPGNADSKPSSKISPVSVDVGKLQLVPSWDIEMLSAQSSDGRAMDTQHTDALTVDKQLKEDFKLDQTLFGEKEPKLAVDKKGANTISEDTRALVKQALMNATQRRQRAESQGDDSKDPKPVTAAQRQREREERRRKKKERALEKVKKSKEKKQPSSVALSSQDLELLRRWTVMQNPGQSEHVSQSPPHPGPAVSPPQATAIAAKSVSARSSVNSCSTQKPAVSLSSQQIASNVYFTTTTSKHRQILAKTTAATTVTLASSVSITPSRLSSGGPVLFPSTQLTLSQANFIPVIAIPSSVNPGQLEIKRIFQPAQTPVTNVPSSLQTSDSSHNFVPAGVLKPNLGSFHTDTHTINTHSAAETDTATDVVQTENVSPVLPAQVSFPNVNNIIGDKIGIQINVNHNQFSTSIVSAKGSLKSEAEAITKDDELSPGSQGNDLLEFLNHHLRDTSGEKHIQDTGNATMQTVYVNQNPLIHQQNAFILDGTSPEASQQHSLTPPPAYSNYSQACNSQEHLARSSSTPSLLRQNSNSPNFQSKQHELQHRSSVPVITCADQPFSSFPIHNNFAAGFQTSQDSQPESFPQTNTAASFDCSFTSQNNYQKFSQAADVINYDSQIHHSGMLYQSAPDFSLPMQHQQLCNQTFQSASSYNEFNSFSSCATSRLSSMQYHHSFSEYSKLQAQQPEFSSNRSFQTSSYVGAASSHIVTQQIPEASRPHASLHSQTSAASAGSFTSLLQQHGADILPGQPTQGTLHPGHKLTVNCSSHPRLSDANAELITLLTKQLSKQHMMGSVPALALTPRGTGAGYGVGMDLDAMLTDAQDNAGVRAEQSPLSSSLLADWLDISANISQADLEALEQELALASPMHVSYDGSM